MPVLEMEGDFQVGYEELSRKVGLPLHPGARSLASKGTEKIDS